MSVVDDLEEEPDVVAEREPRRSRVGRDLRHIEPHARPDATNSRPVLSRCSSSRSPSSPVMSTVLAADHPERRAPRARARRRSGSYVEREAATPPPGARRRRGARRLRRRRRERSDVRGARRRRPARAGRRGRARTCGRARARPPAGAQPRRLAPLASATARQRTGRIRFPPDSSEYRERLVRAAEIGREARARRGTPRRASRSSSAGRIGAGCAPASARPRSAVASSASSAMQIDGRVAVDVVGRREPLEVVRRCVAAAPSSSSARPSASSTGLTPPPPRARRAPRIAVDEPRGVLGRVPLREHDRLVDRDLARHRLLLELVHADAQDIAPRAYQAGRRASRRTRRRSARRARAPAPATASASERAKSSGAALEQRGELLPREIPLVEEEERLRGARAFRLVREPSCGPRATAGGLPSRQGSVEVE